MGRKVATPPIASQGADAAPVGAPARPRWPLGFTGTALAVVAVALSALVAFVLWREAAAPARKPAVASVSAPARPAFTPAEEAYIRALWPIHGDVERSTVRMSLGQIFYKIDDMDRATLKRRVDDALATYQRSEARLLALEPPPSVRREHERYLAAVRLFRDSAVEVLKMFQDGRDDHMNAAYPLSQQASDTIREVGAKFWRDEFTAN